ncbi:MAG: DUF2118 domain-containing protein, partial [Candidatus Eremiobacterota bacterium]
MGEFRMPSLGTDMEAGTLVAWFVKPGDRVKRGDLLAEVNTDKGDIEVEVFEDGVVEQLLVQPGQKVPVDTVLAILAPLEVVAVGASSAEAPASAVAPRAVRLHASPLARRVAAELGVDLARVRGTGTGGAITRADVERAAGVVPPAPGVEAPRPSLER